LTASSSEPWSQSDQNAVREQLERILKSTPFQQSQRRRRFLEYVVNEKLAGRGDRLKGYAIAREVFDRPEEFDPNVDPIVRMEAARLRDRLREYYDGEGKDDPVRIELPKGSYVPQIELLQEPPTGAPMERTAIKGDAISSQWTSRKIALPFAVLAILLAVAGVWFAAAQRHPQPREVVNEAERTLADVPAVAVLPFVNLSGDAKQDYFSDGLTEDILTELSRARDLRVLARNTSF